MEGVDDGELAGEGGEGGTGRGGVSGTSFGK